MTPYIDKNAEVNDQISSQQIALPGGPYTALLLDLDGVITDTASVHTAAWKQTFDTFLEQQAQANGTPFVPFDAVHDYQTYVDGKPRNNGVSDFLASRNISLPEGTPTSAPGNDTVWGIGNLKNEVFLELLKKEGVKTYEGSVKFLKAARAAKFHTAVVSSSANTLAVLQSANLVDDFDVRVDGVTIIEQHLAGKPAPDTFLEAARLLNAPISECVVFEDALAGVAAGKAGHFGLIVGVDRVGHADALREHGADIVVQDLGELLSNTAPAETARMEPHG